MFELIERRRLVAAAAACLCAVPLTVAGPMRPASAVDGLHLKTFAAANEGAGPRTREQALLDAKNFDVISALPGTYREHIAAMRAANPQLVVLAYMNGTFAQKSEGTAYPENWYARDSNGEKVRSLGFGNYLMQPTNVGWIDTRISACRNLISQTGYQGCMVDMVGTAPVQPGYTTALPINPATGAVWTEPDYQRATAALIQRMNDAVSTGLVWGNGYGTGSRYFTDAMGPSRVLNAGVDGALTESWLRTAHMGIDKFRPEKDWKMAVDQLVHLGQVGERTGVMVKLWASGTQSQKDRYHRYALASFLLGSNGKSSISVSYESDADILARHLYWSRTNIGTPTAAYALTGGVYQRPFLKGKVLVNPTSVTRTISLGGTYTDLQGTARSSITLPPNTGDVLTKVL